MTNDNDWCAIVKPSDIYKVEIKRLRSVLYYTSFPNLEDFEITIDKGSSMKESIMENLNFIPRKLNLLINIGPDGEWILYDSDFWNFIINFSSVNIERIIIKKVDERRKDQERNLKMYKRECMLASREDNHALYGLSNLKWQLQRLVESNWLI